MVFWFKPGDAVLSDGYTGWVEENASLVERFARSTAERKYGSDEQLIARMHNEPKVAYHVLQDRYRYDNQQKLDMCLVELLTGSKIIVIFGDRGEGKSALAWALAHYAHLRGRKVYTSYVDEVPEIAELIDGPTECPEGGLYLMDEAHMSGLHARRGNSNQSMGILNQLSVLRHGGRSFIMITQDAGFIDKNAKKLYNVALFKRLPVGGDEGSGMNDKTSTSGMIFPGYQVMLPRTPIKTYYQSRNFQFTVEFGLSPWWSEKWSESFGVLKNPDIAKKIILKMQGSDARPPAIKMYLNSRGFQIELVEISHIIKEHNDAIIARIKGETVGGILPQYNNSVLQGSDPVVVFDRLWGGECETIEEVKIEMNRLGYGVTGQWVQRQVLDKRMAEFTALKLARGTS